MRPDDPAPSAPPLSHIRVLDLGRVMAAPWCTQILADMGADVIKIERPEVGDDTRGWGPPFLERGDGRRDAGYFLSVNRGKRSVTVDLASPEGREVVLALARTADIVVENYKVGALKRYGLDYDSLRAANPHLIYASITGFGQDGPRATQAAYDFMVQAMGGLMSVTGERDGQPGAGPQKVGVPIVDIMTGMYATVAILGALARRDHTGRGDYIDLAMLDVQVGFLANQAMNYLLTDQLPRRNGNSHPNIQPQDVYPCGEGHIVLAVGNDGQFAKLCEVLGAPELATDERFATNAQRVANLVALNAILRERLQARPMKAWVADLEAAGVPCGPINTVREVFDDPQVRTRELLRQIEGPDGPIPQVASPIRYREARMAFDRPPPRLGEHTAEVLAELGLGPASVDPEGAV
jgi:crotonobetainyl-CoA:carnitine CoA-transferase CaiB-like acyl-CoA transferase